MSAVSICAKVNPPVDGLFKTLLALPAVIELGPALEVPLIPITVYGDKCSSLPKVTLSSAIFAVVTADAASLAVDIPKSFTLIL